MKILELYSGIGGMHLALKESKLNGDIIASIDINPTANTVYKHNFPGTLLLNRNIQCLTSKYIKELKIDTILMSPPCQPFTRNGLKKDISDARTESFVHILKLLPELEVRYILLENVKGFESSEMRENFIQTLKTAKFIYQEFLLSPTQFGVPNSRPRYYCIAKKDTTKFCFAQQELMESFPEELCETDHSFTVSEILEESNLESYYIADNLLLKQAMTLDICFCDSVRTCCFTKSYGRYVTGTGSVFTLKSKQEVDEVYKLLECYKEDSAKRLESVKSLKLRFFTPREVCRLMCFPETFTFSANVTDRQKYMLLGNSINVKVVAELLKILVS